MVTWAHAQRRRSPGTLGDGEGWQEVCVCSSFPRELLAAADRHRPVGTARGLVCFTLVWAWLLPYLRETRVKMQGSEIR